MLFTLLLILLAWNHLSDDGRMRGMTTDLDRIVHSSSLSLVTSSGIPSNWYNVSNESVVTLGIMDSSGSLLSMERVFALSREDLDSASLLGVLGPGYDYYVHLLDLSGVIIFSGGNDPDGATVVAVREYVLFNGTDPLVFRMGVWQ